MRKQEEYEQEKASHQLLHLGAELLKLQLARPVAVQDLADSHLHFRQSCLPLAPEVRGEKG